MLLGLGSYCLCNYIINYLELLWVWDMLPVDFADFKRPVRTCFSSDCNAYWSFFYSFLSSDLWNVSIFLLGRTTCYWECAEFPRHLKDLICIIITLVFVHVDFKLAVLIFRCLHVLAPRYLTNDIRHVADTSRRCLCSLSLPHNITSAPAIPVFCVCLFQRSFPS